MREIFEHKGKYGILKDSAIECEADFSLEEAEKIMAAHNSGAKTFSETRSNDVDENQRMRHREITTLDMEIALARRFDHRRNLIVPNVSWGFSPMGRPLHECDLLVMTKNGYLYEIEIKTSLQDLARDKKKSHGHRHKAIRRLYFAITEQMCSNNDDVAALYEHVPKRAGVLVAYYWNHMVKIKDLRPPLYQKGHKLTLEERYKLAHLGAMRIWDLKTTIKNYCLEQ
jgi:hypothetical protein